MDQNIKNRLVGIVVIFALAVIFLPIILDGSGVRKDKLEVVIPPQPVISENPDFESKLIELKASVDALPELDARFIDENSPDKIERTQKSKAESNTASSPETQSKPESGSTVAVKTKIKSGGDSWVLQVGSFQDRKKALVQRDKLRKSNIAAVFIEQFDIDNQPSYRVRLGPFLIRDQTRVAQNKGQTRHRWHNHEV